MLPSKEQTQYEPKDRAGNRCGREAGQAEPQALAAVAGPRARLKILLEYSLEVLGRDADPRVPHADPQPLAAPAASDQHLALARVLDRVRD